MYSWVNYVLVKKLSSCIRSKFKLNKKLSKTLPKNIKFVKYLQNSKINEKFIKNEDAY